MIPFIEAITGVNAFLRHCIFYMSYPSEFVVCYDSYTFSFIPIKK